MTLTRHCLESHFFPNFSPSSAVLSIARILNEMAVTELGVNSTTGFQHTGQTEQAAPGLDVGADEALKVVRGIDRAGAGLDEATGKRILRKLDLILLPVSLRQESHWKLT